MTIISGFSKLSKNKKIEFLNENYLDSNSNSEDVIKQFWNADEKVQELLDEFSENTVTNFPMPYGLAPNFLINAKEYCIPMVIEESSVVAACARTAKFWQDKGGFKTKVLSTYKIGQVHFFWHGDKNRLERHFVSIKDKMFNDIAPIVQNMQSRGGGVHDIELRDLCEQESGYYQLFVSFETCDAMGANFINSTLESLAQSWKTSIEISENILSTDEKNVEIIMSILSNYTPDCIVRAEVSCRVDQLQEIDPSMSAQEFASKFKKAVRIANIDPYRAATHNKGIFNGVDSVVLATGNDFRAVEACGHTYAARSGQYRSLTHCEVNENVFKFWIELPISIGTIGGLTNLHPLAKTSLEILGNPSAKELMEIIASVGLAQNFAAIRSLVTSGIQKGHMKMHLMNILKSFDANQEEVDQTKYFFDTKIVSYSSVREYLHSIRTDQDREVR